MSNTSSQPAASGTPNAAFGHLRIQIVVLLLLLISGSMGAPLIGPIREKLQHEANLSRAELGQGILFVGLVGGFAGLLMGLFRHRFYRATLLRCGSIILAISCILIAFTPVGPGWPLAVLGLSWFLLGFGHPMLATGNGIFSDLWHHSPHTGVILLHAFNAAGKLLAPLVVLYLGTDLRSSGLFYSAITVVLALATFLLWPRHSLHYLKEAELRQAAPTISIFPRHPIVWLYVLQFAFISGSEAGATAILASFIKIARPALWATPERWAALVTALLLAGILAGRVTFAFASSFLYERAIIILCLLTGLGALPAVWTANPWVYLPAIFITGWAFSATWPAFFTLVARSYPSEKTLLAMGAAFFSAIGTSVGIYLASFIGNDDALLPTAFVASTAMLLPFAVFLFATPPGRRLWKNNSAPRI
ncbi:MAG: hypothetical protein IT443_03870 [Phycisphaeraceae bacterium]|nr:hypothetical protein [Phycisphaeraceae bacterium]